MKSLFRALASGLVLLCIFSSCEKEHVNTPPVVDAGNDRVLTLPVDTVNLSGTGTDADGKLVSYLWSEVSGPGIAKIAGPGLPSTLISGLVAGRYVFQLFVTDDQGGTGTDTVAVMVNPALIQTISIQPQVNSNEINFAGNSTDNYSDALTKELDAGAWTRDGSLDLLRGAFKIDMKDLPPTAVILSAKLSLFSNPTPINGNLKDANSGSDNSMLIQRIVSSWTNSSTWQTQPSTTSADQIMIPHTNLVSLDLLNVEVTDMVQKMYSTTNYGFMIRLQNEAVYNIRNFCSSRYPDASKHPKLVITYSLK